MASFIIPKILYLLSVIALCSHTHVTANVIDDHFKTDSCDNPKFQTILRMVPAKTTIASSVVHCAIQCHRKLFCVYAIFDNRNKTCEHIYGVSNTFRPMNPEYVIDNDISNASCKVLTKVVVETWTPFTMGQIMELQGYEDYSVMKYDKAGLNVRHHMFLVSQFNVNEAAKGYTLATYGKFISFVLKRDRAFSNPYRNKVIFLYGDIDSVTLNLNYVDIADGEIETEDIDLEQSAVCVRKHFNLESEVKLAENYQDVLDLVLQGARRLMRHPTTIFFNWATKQIRFDTTETTLIELPGAKPPQPLYFKSIKETFNEDQSGVRYVLKHKMFDDHEKAYKTTEITDSGPLAFETNWLHISQVDIQAVKKAALEGRPVRMFVASLMFTDVNMIYIAPDDILVSFTSFISPITGSWAIRNKRFMRFPLFRESDKTYVECRASSIKGNSPFTVAETSHSRTNLWFVSKKAWIELYVIDKAQNVLSGTLQALREYIFRREDIRVCVEETIQTVYCLSMQYVTSGTGSSDSRFQSYPFVNPSEAFDGKTVTCPPQKMMLISSDGWIETIEFNVGYPDIESDGLSFEAIHWFAEPDYLPFTSEE